MTTINPPQGYEYPSANRFDFTQLVGESDAQLSTYGIAVQPLGTEQLDFALQDLPDVGGEPGLKLVIGSARRSAVKVYLSPETTDDAPRSVTLGSVNFDPKAPGNLQFVAVAPDGQEREFGNNGEVSSERLGLAGPVVSARQFGAALTQDGKTLLLRDLGSRNGTRVLYGAPVPEGDPGTPDKVAGRVTLKAAGRAAVGVLDPTLR
jgi:hypothetical protein